MSILQFRVACTIPEERCRRRGRKGVLPGQPTTRGFRDVLELRRRDRPDTYGLQGTFEPLIPRHHRLEVTERTDYRGTILQPLDEQEVAARARDLLAEGVEAVVVSFLHAYANPTNERRARQVLETVWPNAYIVTASEVLPEFREFERTSTAVVNAYVQPLIDRYLRSLAQQLRQKGYGRDLLLIQSNGGVMSLEVSRRFSVNTVLSGPAAGVIAATRVGFADPSWVRRRPPGRVHGAGQRFTQEVRGFLARAV